MTNFKNSVPGVWRLHSALVDGKRALGAKPDGLFVLTPTASSRKP